VVGFVAAAPQWKVLHGGGLLGVVAFAPLFLFGVGLRRWFGDCMCAVGGWALHFTIFSAMVCFGAVLLSQSKS
jgi:hypothetical protein